MTENQLRYLAHQETARHNAATEEQAASELEEKSLHNRTQEGIDQQKADTEDSKLAETIRSNQVREGETSRLNTANIDMARRKLDQDLGLGMANTILSNGIKLVDAFVPG